MKKSTTGGKKPLPKSQQAAADRKTAMGMSYSYAYEGTPAQHRAAGRPIKKLAKPSRYQQTKSSPYPTPRGAKAANGGMAVLKKTLKKASKGAKPGKNR